MCTECTELISEIAVFVTIFAVISCYSVARPESLVDFGVEGAGLEGLDSLSCFVLFCALAEGCERQLNKRKG